MPLAPLGDPFGLEPSRQDITPSPEQIPKEEIKRHAFFASIDFNRLLNKEIDPPFKPAVTSMDSTVYFDPEFTKRTPKDSPCVPPSAAAHELFRGFSFVCPAAMEEMRERRGKEAQTVGGAVEEKKIRTIATARTHPITDDYFILEVVGKGSHSEVRKCVHKISKREFVVKKMDKSAWDASEEVDILLRYGHHQHIVKLFEVYEDEICIQMVMEHCKGGELLDRILKKKSFTEREAASVMASLAAAVHYLHSNQNVFLGTIGEEISRQVSDADAVFLAVGGGGMASGVAAYLGEKRPDIKVYLVEPEGKELSTYLASGQLSSERDALDTVADGIRVHRVGSNCLPILKKYCNGQVITVSEEEIREAVKLIWTRTKQRVEPAAGVPLAGLLKLRPQEKGIKKAVVILCGGNVDLNFVP